MPRRRPQPDEGGPSNEWMVTFSDCMTLLLTFFVMLLSFSSFAPKELTLVMEGFAMAARPSVFENKRLPREAYLKDDPVVDWTAGGSEMPTDLLTPTITPPPPEDLTAREAHRDRRVLHVPSDLLFWGRGSRLRPEGRALLDRVAEFLRLMPCRVVVRESGRPDADLEAALARALAITTYLTETAGLPADRFAVAPPRRTPGTLEPTVQIAMLNPEVFP